MPYDPAYAEAIATIESGGKYDKLGPETKGDRAYGRYQVMGRNIPAWTEAALGKRLTPQEFLANPAAQDAVFQHRFGGYADKYGPAGAARAWFAGERGMGRMDAKDSLGTSVKSYETRFLKQLENLKGKESDMGGGLFGDILGKIAPGMGGGGGQGGPDIMRQIMAMFGGGQGGPMNILPPAAQQQQPPAGAPQQRPAMDPMAMQLAMQGAQPPQLQMPQQPMGMMRPQMAGMGAPPGVPNFAQMIPPYLRRG